MLLQSSGFYDIAPSMGESSGVKDMNPVGRGPSRVEARFCFETDMVVMTLENSHMPRRDRRLFYVTYVPADKSSFRAHAQTCS